MTLRWSWFGTNDVIDYINAYPDLHKQILMLGILELDSSKEYEQACTMVVRIALEEGTIEPLPEKEFKY